MLVERGKRVVEGESRERGRISEGRGGFEGTKGGEWHIFIVDGLAGRISSRGWSSWHLMGLLDEAEGPLRHDARKRPFKHLRPARTA
jgi:hypothetical protein